MLRVSEYVVLGTGFREDDSRHCRRKPTELISKLLMDKKTAIETGTIIN